MLESPYDKWSSEQFSSLVEKAKDANPVTSSFDGANQEIQHLTGIHIADISERLLSLSHQIHANPELAFKEYTAVQAISALLGEEGFEVTASIGGLNTAFVTEYTYMEDENESDHIPTIAILAEYDALAGIGHACGHNVIAATAVGAFLTVARVLKEHKIIGRVKLYGCPGEEGKAGKEIMARTGIFDTDDAAIMLHGYMADILEQPWLGNMQTKISFYGRAAHASASPFLGINALDAAVATYNAIAAMRQHMLPNDRVHAVFTPEGAGGPGNIVPEFAQLHVHIRSQEMSTLQILHDRLEQIANGVGITHGVKVEFDWDSYIPYFPTRLNHSLGARYAVAMSDRGRTVLPSGVFPEYLTASTDLGNISQRIPAIHPTLQTAPLGIGLHTEAFREYAISEISDKAVLDGAYALAMTALDFLCDESLREAVKEEFEASGGRIDSI